MIKKKKYYVVWKGRKTGVFDDWKICEAQIKGFEGAKFKGFPTKEEAEKAFKNPSFSFSSAKNLKQNSVNPLKDKSIKPILESLSVDAACSGNPGNLEYRGVNTLTKEQIFKQGVFPMGTNNVGEFLAIVHGLAYLKKQNSKIPLYSDSKTAIAWVKKKHANTKLEQNKKNDELFELIDRAELWLKENTYENKILKWETEIWGEIPADFGRK